MPAARRITLSTMTSPAALLLAVSQLVGCGATPDTDHDAVPHQDPVAGAASGAASTAGAASTSPGVPLLRRTEDVNGSPNLYTLKLINDGSGLPAPVADALRPDFGSESVVFLGMGRQEGEGFATRITGVSRTGDELTVSAEFTQPAGSPGGDATTPWSAVVVPKQEGVATPLLSDFR